MLNVVQIKCVINTNLLLHVHHRTKPKNLTIFSAYLRSTLGHWLSGWQPGRVINKSVGGEG